MYNPIIFETDKMGSFSYDLFSRLLKDRIIFLTGEINSYISNTIVSSLLYLDNISHDDIFLYINSPGGEIDQGMAIIDTIKYIKSDVVTIAIGLVASMASIVLACGAENKRMSLKNTTIMIHQPLAGFSGQASDMDIINKHLQFKKLLLIDILSEATKQNRNKIKQDIDRDYYLTVEEALKYRLIDKIL